MKGEKEEKEGTLKKWKRCKQEMMGQGKRLERGRNREGNEMGEGVGNIRLEGQAAEGRDVAGEDIRQRE